MPANHHSNYGGHYAIAVAEAKVLHECYDMGSMLPRILQIFMRQQVYHTIWWPFQPRMPPLPRWHCNRQPGQPKNASTKDKADPFCKGVNIYLGATERDLCPIRGILPYLALRGNRSGPLFILSDGRGLTWQLFKVALDNLLSALKMAKGSTTPIASVL